MTTTARRHLSPLEAAAALTWILEQADARLSLSGERLTVDLDRVVFPVGECDRAYLQTIIAALEPELIAVLRVRQRVH